MNKLTLAAAIAMIFAVPAFADQPPAQRQSDTVGATTNGAAANPGSHLDSHLHYPVEQQPERLLDQRAPITPPASAAPKPIRPPTIPTTPARPPTPYQGLVQHGQPEQYQDQLVYQRFQQHQYQCHPPTRRPATRIPFNTANLNDVPRPRPTRPQRFNNTSTSTKTNASTNDSYNTLRPRTRTRSTPPTSAAPRPRPMRSTNDSYNTSTWNKDSFNTANLSNTSTKTNASTNNSYNPRMTTATRPPGLPPISVVQLQEYPSMQGSGHGGNQAQPS